MFIYLFIYESPSSSPGPAPSPLLDYLGTPSSEPQREAHLLAQ
jgi:hypothetical protein